MVISCIINGNHLNTICVRFSQDAGVILRRFIRSNHYTMTKNHKRTCRPSGTWFVYMVRCNDNTLYTGITTDLARRLAEHNTPTYGARYTRTRRPVKLVYSESAASRSDASKREFLIRKLSVGAKLKLIEGSTG